MNRLKSSLAALAACAALCAGGAAEAAERWSAAKANAWYDAQPWLVGSNYNPATAINQLDMWQADSFDPATIDKELGWAKALGMNTMRVYLHDLVWAQDPQGYRQRIDQFLSIAAKHGVRPMFVLFDSCWDPDPKLGPQRPPIPGVHNSGWVQGPGRNDLINPKNDARFRAYVEGVVGAFADDKRILAWDVWNEPDNPGGGGYNDDQLKAEEQRIVQLLPQVFEWARSRNPVQPLTSGVWIGDDWSPQSKTLTRLQRIQLAESDVISFHDYNWPEVFERRVRQLQPYGRPILCTEYMARGNGSTFDTVLPLGKRMNVAMINWGFVDGETQTRFPWDSWERPYTMREPTIWFHEVLRADGTPYRQAETDLIRRLAAAPKGVVPSREVPTGPAAAR